MITFYQRNDTALQEYVTGRLGKGAWTGMKRRMQALVDVYGES